MIIPLSFPDNKKRTLSSTPKNQTRYQELPIFSKQGKKKHKYRIIKPFQKENSLKITSKRDGVLIKLIRAVCDDYLFKFTERREGKNFLISGWTHNLIQISISQKKKKIHNEKWGKNFLSVIMKNSLRKVIKITFLSMFFPLV